MLKKSRFLKLPDILAIIFLTLFFILFTTIALHRFWQYSAWYYDFGIFYQAIFSVSQGKEPIIDHFIFHNKNILGDHFHPFIFILSPLLLLFPQAETILIAQTLFITLSGFFIYLTAQHILKNKHESLAILIIYLSFIGLHNALITEFHAITLLPLPLSIFFYAMVSKKKLLYTISFLAILLTKETTFIIPAFFGLYIALKNKDEWKKIGIKTTIFSTLYGIIIIKYIMPFFSGMDHMYIKEAVNDFSWQKLIDPFKLQLIFKTWMSFGFLPIFAPEILPPVIANWISRFISQGGRSDLGMHYNAEVAPTLALSTIIGFKRLKYGIHKYSQNKPLLKNLIKIKSNSLALMVLWILTGVSVFLSVTLFNSPIKLAFNHAFYQHTQNFKFLDKLISNIPQDGIVMAQHNIAGKLAYRKVYILRDNYKDYNPDYIVIDTRLGQEPNNFLGLKSFEKIVNKLKNDPEYYLYYDQGEQRIYKKL
jgi:uncharacterized membrane protein